MSLPSKEPLTSVISKMPLKSSEISAVIIRADGTREELGVVSYWHKNPLKRILHKLKLFTFKFTKTIGV